jgi:hypothetical protein
MIGDTYPRYAMLKSRVIDVAYKELKELYEKGQCDVCFNYSEDRAGRTVLGLRVKVISKKSEETELRIDDLIYYIKSWLSNWLNAGKKPKNKAWIDNVIKQLQVNPSVIPKLYVRLVKMQEKEPSTSFAALARHIIEEDFLT